jgi:homoserine dehydrogenase
MSEVQIGLLGYGCVGSAVDRLLHEQADAIEQTTGLRLRVTRALVRDLGKPRAFSPRPGVLTTEFAEIADDPSIRIVAEVMGGLAPTEHYVRTLLAAGKPVASANKQLLARRGGELAWAAAQAGQPLRFEAAVCGAVPVVRTLCEAVPPGTVRRITGVVNGTSNYVLGRMEKGFCLRQALTEAQKLGYAEADPSEDITGKDAAAKMALIATLAFGRRVALDEVDRTGISKLIPDDLAAARSRAQRLRLVGEATLANGSIAVRVGPTELAESDPLSRVPAAFNEVAIEGETFGRIVLHGPGAGGPETASAVVSDLLTLAVGGAASHVARLAPARSAGGGLAVAPC